jgi:hypothetical protein
MNTRQKAKDTDSTICLCAFHVNSNTVCIYYGQFHPVQNVQSNHGAAKSMTVTKFSLIVVQ